MQSSICANLITPVNILKMLEFDYIISGIQGYKDIKIQRMNCRNLIISNFNIQATLFNQYLEPISTVFNQKNIDNAHNLHIVSQNDFVAQVLSDPKNVGICIGSSGVPESVYLNQKQGIRAALAHTKYIAQMCRKHNDANVIILSVDNLGIKLAASLVDNYLLSGFDNEQRNMIRVEKMGELDKKYWQ